MIPSESKLVRRSGDADSARGRRDGPARPLSAQPVQIPDITVEGAYESPVATC